MIEPGLWRHWKGKLYVVLGAARHTERDERLVLYRELHAPVDAEPWARPEAMWREAIESGEPRFDLIATYAPRDAVWSGPGLYKWLGVFLPMLTTQTKRAKRRRSGTVAVPVDLMEMLLAAAESYLEALPRPGGERRENE